MIPKDYQNFNAQVAICFKTLEKMIIYIKNYSKKME